MTRDEALRRLEGTWSFELAGDQVLLRDIDLLSAVAALRRDGGERVQAATGRLQEASASGD